MVGLLGPVELGWLVGVCQLLFRLIRLLCCWLKAVGIPLIKDIYHFNFLRSTIHLIITSGMI